MISDVIHKYILLLLLKNNELYNFLSKDYNSRNETEHSTSTLLQFYLTARSQESNNSIKMCVDVSDNTFIKLKIRFHKIID